MINYFIDVADMLNINLRPKNPNLLYCSGIIQFSNEIFLNKIIFRMLSSRSNTGGLNRLCFSLGHTDLERTCMKMPVFITARQKSSSMSSKTVTSLVTPDRSRSRSRIGVSQSQRE